MKQYKVPVTQAMVRMMAHEYLDSLTWKALDNLFYGRVNNCFSPHKKFPKCFKKMKTEEALEKETAAEIKAEKRAQRKAKQ